MTQLPATMPPTAPPDSSRRLPLLDALRGIAVMMMIAYHFLFDTTYFKLTQFHMLVEPGWILWRDLIVSSFLLITGISLVLAQHQSARGLLRRNLQIGGSAALVSIGSYLVFPASFIYFGILHFNLLASLICAPLRRLGRWTLPLGIVAGLAGILLSSPLFDPKYINWLGFVTHKPITEDYVPLFPWLGVVLVGMAIGRHWQQHGLTQPASLAALSARLPAWLRWLGRHSLLVYLIHQPLLFAGFEAARGLQLIR